jgi:hypothetical protein
MVQFLVTWLMAACVSVQTVGKGICVTRSYRALKNVKMEAKALVKCTKVRANANARMKSGKENYATKKNSALKRLYVPTTALF